MQVVILKYFPILCITIFSGNVQCNKLVIQKEEVQIFKISSCAAQCMQNESNLTLSQCYESCRKVSEQLPVMREMENDFDITYGLHCRDDRKIVLKFYSNQVDSSSFLYLIKIYKTKEDGPKEIILTNDSLIEIGKLDPSTLYVISATVISPDYTLRQLEGKNFSTLSENFTPQEIKNIWLSDFIVNEKNDTLLDFYINWKPANDATCYYEVVFAVRNEIKQREIRQPQNLYTHKIRGIEFNANFSYAVHGENLKTDYFTLTVWKTMRLPGCTDMYGNQTGLCPVNNVKITKCQYYPTKSKNYFDIHVAWEVEGRNLPEFYYLKLYSSSNSTHFLEIPTTAGFNENIAVFKNIHTNHSFSIFVTAVSLFGNTTEVNQFEIANVLFHFDNMLIAGLAISMVLCSFAVYIIFYIHKKRIFHIQTDDIPLKNLNAFIKISKIEDVNELFAISNDILEIPREKITIYGILGEGNFGKVKKAVIKNEFGSEEVAVKMLKEDASLTDLRQFRLEIDMMKSVGKHPNILRLIGHSTKKMDELMLITEYCAKGNLRDFLRSEWDKLKIKSLSISKCPDNIFNFDKNFSKKPTSYKNLGESIPHLKSLNITPIIEDQQNSDSNNNSDKSDSGNWAHLMMDIYNPSYLQTEKNKVEVSSNLLLNFAKQIADGMNFLSKCKIVHRDLAARNVLVGANNVAKIADFGLSRDIYQDNLYKKTGTGKLPIKWLAVECMSHQIYTFHSDVWAYGILLYEIVTLGGTPYPSVESEKLMSVLQQGYRMEKPKQCSIPLYNLMLDCWKENPRERPTFKQVLSRLQDLSNLPMRHIDLNSIFINNGFIKSSEF